MSTVNVVTPVRIVPIIGMSGKGLPVYGQQTLESWRIVSVEQTTLPDAPDIAELFAIAPRDSVAGVGDKIIYNNQTYTVVRLDRYRSHTEVRARIHVATG
jgi:hypothetical protein